MPQSSLQWPLVVCLMFACAEPVTAQRPEERLPQPLKSTSLPATSPTPALSTVGNWDVDKALSHLRKNARPKFGGDCAKYTRQAIEAGADGKKMERTDHAKDYGQSLRHFGFREYSSTEITPKDFKKGDVVVIQAAEGHPSGHMAMYDGKQWISDFKQRDHWGGAIRDASPSYKIYRFDPGNTSGSPADRGDRAGPNASGSGLGGVLINPTPLRDEGNEGGGDPAQIIRGRPSEKARSWRIKLPNQGAKDDHKNE